MSKAPNRSQGAGRASPINTKVKPFSKEYLAQLTKQMEYYMALGSIPSWEYYKVAEPIIQHMTNVNTQLEVMQPANQLTNINLPNVNGNAKQSNVGNFEGRQHTPSTLPRTKFTVATPLEDRMAMNKLKQKLYFKDDETEDQVLTVPSFVKLIGDDDLESVSSKTNSLQVSLKGSEASDLIDPHRIMERLEQVKEYLKQATAMYVNMSTSDAQHGSKANQLEKLAQLIQQLRLQEQGYIDLLQRTMATDRDLLGENDSFASSETSESDQEDESIANCQTVDTNESELQALVEQRDLLSKIAEQGKQLKNLKSRHSMLLTMQEKAQSFIEDASRNASMDMQNNATKHITDHPDTGSVMSTENEAEEMLLQQADAQQKRLELETKLESLQEKKHQMDYILSALQKLKASQTNLRQQSDDTEGSISSKTTDTSKDIPADKANQIELLNELMSLGSKIGQVNICEESNDNFEIRNLRPGQSNALTDGEPSLEEDRKQLMLLQKQHQYLLEMKQKTDKLKQHKNKPANSKRKQSSDSNASSKQHALFPGGARPRQSKNDNQREHANRGSRKKSQKSKKRGKQSKSSQALLIGGQDTDLNKLLELADSNELLSKIEELQRARDHLMQLQQDAANNSKQSQTHSTSDVSSVVSNQSLPSESGTDISNRLAWNDDPEFQAKVAKLQLAKQKLKHLQELVKVAQQGPGPVLPIDDLADLSMSEIDDTTTIESMQDDDKEDADENNDGIDENDDSTMNSESQQEYASSVDDAEHTLSYREQLLQQHSELERLLAEKQELLDLKRHLSNEKNKQVSTQTQSPVYTASNGDNHHQSRSKGRSPNSGHSFQSNEQQGLLPRMPKHRESIESGSFDGNSSGRAAAKSKVRIQSNPLALYELRRQRGLLEARKKQKFAERLQQIDEGNQSLNYSIPSDVDEGVVVGATSVDNTTATWGGSTVQTNSSDECDSAVEDDMADNGLDYDCYGQVEEEEEEADGTSQAMNDQNIPPPINQASIPPLFEVKAQNLQGIRKIKPWYSRDGEDSRKRKRAKLSGDHSDDKGRGNSGTVSWSSMPQSSNGPSRSRNKSNKHGCDNDSKRRLTKTHLERHDWEQQCQQMYQQLSNSTALSSSLLRNQQTLVAMIQNHGLMNQLHQGPTAVPSYFNASNDGFVTSDPSNWTRRLQDHFAQSQYSNHAASMSNSVNELSRQMRQQHNDLMALEELVRDMTSNPNRIPPFNNIRLNSNQSVSTYNNVRFASSNVADSSFNASNIAVNQTDYSSPGGMFAEATRSLDTSGPFMSFNGNPESLPNRGTAKQPPNNNGVIFGGLPNQDMANSGIQSNTGNGFSPFQMHETGLYTQSHSSGQQRSPQNTKHQHGGMNKKVEAKNTNVDDSAIAQVQSSQVFVEDSLWSPSLTPSKQAAMSTLASKAKPSNRNSDAEATHPNEQSIHVVALPLSQEDCDNVSMPDDASRDSQMEDANNFSLFEALRESIYSEVATLISMNESKPHFLIELFRELQLLTSDYLRQRALYALQDLVTRYLTEEGGQQEILARETVDEDEWAVRSVTEQTPSESVMTSDDEEEKRMLLSLVGENRRDDAYDYAEYADVTSSVATPMSSIDHPFATDGLGETVINLEEAMQQMRRYDEAMSEAQDALNRMSIKAEATKAQLKHTDPFHTSSTSLEQQSITSVDEVASNSTYDVDSEVSVDQPASADVQRLDANIKSIMKELIRYLNDHMDEMCTADLLGKIRQVVVILAKQKEPDVDKEEFGRFFHRQLESILRDTLTKFVGRKLKECGEEILIDVSEILFNELAFFRLMEDLDKPVFQGQSRELSEMKKIAAAVSASKNDVSPLSAHLNGNINHSPISQNSDRQTSHDSSDRLSEDYVKVDGFLRRPSNVMSSGQSCDGIQDDSKPINITENDLDEASAVPASISPNQSGQDVDDQTESFHQFVNVQLVACESRPIASTSSGEDDAEEEFGVANNNQLSASVVSQRYNTSSDSETESQDDRNTMPESDENRTPSASVSSPIIAAPLEDINVAVEEDDDDTTEQHDENDEDEATRGSMNQNDSEADVVDDILDATADNDDGDDCEEQDERSEDVQHGEEQARAIDPQVPSLATEAEGSGTVSYDQESEEVTIDDLPAKLTGLTEADLQTQMESEESSNQGAQAVLTYLNDTPELAGNDDSSTVRQPNLPCNGHP